MFILDHKFWTRNAGKSIKGSKDLGSSLVSNENCSEILWPSGWAPGHITWAKIYFTYGITHKKSETPNQKSFFRV